MTFVAKSIPSSGFPLIRTFFAMSTNLRAFRPSQLMSAREVDAEFNIIRILSSMIEQQRQFDAKLNAWHAIVMCSLCALDLYPLRL